MERVMSEIWNNKASLTDAGILKLVGSALESKVLEGYGKTFANVDYTTPDAEMLTRLVRDTWHFSAAKNYQQMRDMTLALKDENGKLRTFGDFKDAASVINSKYNASWLKTEYNQAVGSSTMAARWVDFEKNAKEMPFLRYSTVGDGRVRDAHRSLDGIIRKIDDSFWATHYPPNGWGCRCDVTQLASSSAKETDIIPEVPIAPMFRTNLSASGLVYPAGHPYYDGVPDDVIKQSLQTIPPDAAYKEVYKSAETGKTVQMHILHGINEAIENIKTAKILADSGYNIKLLPLLDDDTIREKLYGTTEFKKGKNPDALVNGTLFEFKAPLHANANGIHKAISRGKDQANNIVIHLPDEMPEKQIQQFVKGQAKQAVLVNEVWVINKAGEPIKYNRKQLGL